MAIQDIPLTEPLRESNPKINANFSELDSGKAAAAHAHANYQALLETNLDLLMRGILYSKANPFSQSFTFSGDGAKTAYKIPRGSVNQQGWVRGGVSATVGGAAATGTYDVHTQTFTFGTAPASGADNVVISSTDVVPYQGMGVAENTVEIVYIDRNILVTTSGTGATTSHAHPWLLTSPKLPVTDIAQDDSLLNDVPSAGSFSTNTSLNLLPASRFHHPAYATPPLAGERGTLTVSAESATARGRVNFRPFWVEGPTLNASIAHLGAQPMLMRVESAASGSNLSTGELVIGVATRHLTNTQTYIGGSTSSLYAFDLFRLSGGPIVEA